jgi:hypothetical protein
VRGQRETSSFVPLASSDQRPVHLATCCVATPPAVVVPRRVAQAAACVVVRRRGRTPSFSRCPAATSSRRPAAVILALPPAVVVASGVERGAAAVDRAGRDAVVQPLPTATAGFHFAMRFTVKGPARVKVAGREGAGPPPS